MSMPGYQTKLQRVAITGANDLVVRSLLDRQQFYDPAGAAQRLGISSASWPLFGLLWPSSIQLASELARRPVNPDERILEIGCGLALASLVAHRRGADITASDCHPLARRFLNENTHLNDLSDLTYLHGQWGDPPPPSLADTGAALLSERYDLIVGSDLLYEPDMPQALADFIDCHALARSEVWIIDPNRGYRTAFNRYMATHGFDLFSDVRLSKQAGSVDAVSANYKGRLLVYRR